MTRVFEPGFILFVDCDFDHLTFAQWFWAGLSGLAVEIISLTSGRLGYNYIEVDKNQVYDYENLSTHAFLRYPHKITVYRVDPLPDEAVLISEQVELCYALLEPVKLKGWKYHVHGEVENYL